MTDKKAYELTALTGGTANALDGKDGDLLQDGDFSFVAYAGTVYFYTVDIDSGLTESVPDVIAPDVNPGNIRHILLGSYVPVATEALAGVSERSTDQEAVTGTLTDKTITPANLKAALIAAGHTEIGEYVEGDVSLTGYFLYENETGTYKVLAEKVNNTPGTGTGLGTYYEGDVSLTGYFTYMDETGTYKVMAEKVN